MLMNLEPVVLVWHLWWEVFSFYHAEDGLLPLSTTAVIYFDTRHARLIVD